MLTFSALFMIVAVGMTLWLLNNSDLLDERRAAFVAFSHRIVRLGLPSLSVSGSTLMLVFGSLCLEYGDFCGPRGRNGGIALVTVGACISVAMVFVLWRRIGRPTWLHLR